MNLIYCDNNCTHQKDGYCTITELKPGSEVQNMTGCIYYVNASVEPKDFTPKSF